MTLATSDVQSRAELYLFELLRRGLSDEYTVVHGARWELPSNAIISTGGNGEADFVVLHPMKGIIVIEAKAGFVEYSPITGKWTIDGGTGSPRRSKRGPLEQAQGNRHALEYALRRAFPEMPRVKLCYAVAVPECTYDMALEPLGLPRSLFLDSAGCANVAVWISGVYEHFGPDGDVISEYVLDLLITLMAGSIQFSSPIKSQMALAHKTIEQLTQNQYHIIKFLTGHRRVAISGCAGSGKTLVAVEKAIRLDRAGLRTMLLCHNPLLADYLRGLTTNTGVVVEDFGSWIGLLTGRSLYEIRNWTHYDEPDGKELAIAFDKLHASRQKYDAIVVDEGQDFRDEWWLLVQVALADQQFGTLYIFHDDNQALLPFRSQYPIEEAPYCLSQNCRNAGEIFELLNPA